MDKRLELIFANELDKSVTLTIDAPTYPADPTIVHEAMDEIIAADVFYSTGGKFVEKRGARFVERIVEEIELH